jgi:hypothetical protein
MKNDALLKEGAACAAGRRERWINRLDAEDAELAEAEPFRRALKHYVSGQQAPWGTDVQEGAFYVVRRANQRAASTGVFAVGAYEELCFLNGHDTRGLPLPAIKEPRAFRTMVLLLRNAEADELRCMLEIDGGDGAWERPRKRIQDRYAQRHHRVLEQVRMLCRELLGDASIEKEVKRALPYYVAALHPERAQHDVLRSCQGPLAGLEESDDAV